MRCWHLLCRHGGHVIGHLHRMRCWHLLCRNGGHCLHRMRCWHLLCRNGLHCLHRMPIRNDKRFGLDIGVRLHV